MAQRHRVCAAIIRDGTILMVRHRDLAREYWTLPGGAIEPGETREQAAAREVLEETGIRATVDRFLFAEPYGDGHSLCSCFLLQADAIQEITLGSDPEEAHLSPEARLLQGVAWLPLRDMASDGQIAQVLKALRPQWAKTGGGVNTRSGAGNFAGKREWNRHDVSRYQSGNARASNTRSSVRRAPQLDWGKHRAIPAGLVLCA
ncbi:MAG: NUDIX hydrolase [Armatimonadota bacterium]